MKKMFLILAYLLSVVSVAVADNLTEEELSALEYKNGAGDFTILSEHFALIRFPILVYAKAFDAEEKNIALPEKKDVDLTKGVELASNIATSPLFVAGGVNSTTGAIGNAATIITAAGMGLNLLNSIFGSDTNTRVRRAELRQMKTPSLYLVRSDPEAKGEELDAAQLKANKLALSLPFDCDVTANRFSGKGIGSSHKEVFYTRGIVCSTDESRAKKSLFGSPIIENRFVQTFRYIQPRSPYDTIDPPNRSVSMISLHSLDRMHYVSMLGIPETDDGEQEKLLGKLAYEKTKAIIPPDWTAIYTAPNAKGDWAVFVARNGVIIEFPMMKS